MSELRQSGRTTLIVTIVMTVLASFALGLRFYCNVKLKRSLNAADYLITAAFANYVVYVVMLLYGLYTSGGSLIQTELQIPQLTNLFKWIYIFTVFFTTCMTLVKLSILMLYHFIFATRKFRRACIAVAGLCLVWFFVTLFLGLFQCKPISGAWDISLLLSGQAQCFTYGNYMIGYELTNVLLDITILALPLWVIKTLHLPPSRKVLVGSIFVLGGFICVVCIIRLSYLYNAQTSNPVGLVNGVNWSTVVLSVAIVCACLPCYGALLNNDKIARKMDTWYKQATGKSRDASTHSRSGKKIGSSQQRSQYNRLRAGEGGKEPSFVTSVAGGSTVRGTDSRSDDHDNPSYPLHAISVARTVDVV